MLFTSLALTLCTVATLPLLFVAIFFAVPMTFSWMIFKFLLDMTDLAENYRFGKIEIMDGGYFSTTDFYVLMRKGSKKTPLTEGNILIKENELTNRLRSFMQLQLKDVGIKTVYVTSTELSICVNAKQFAKKNMEEIKNGI